MHDALTDLPNRAILREQPGDRDRRRRVRPTTGVGVLVLDVDRFKEVNDTLGYQNGDLLLRGIGDADRRDRCPSEPRSPGSAATSSRCCSPRWPIRPTVLAVARELVAALETPFTVDELSVEVEATIGVSVFPSTGPTPRRLLRRADVAMQRAKESHVGVELYADEHDTYSRRGSASIADLRRGAGRRRARPALPAPGASCATGRVPGVEALLRWNHPHDGLLRPDEFIPLAERSGLIHPLTELRARARAARSAASLARQPAWS